jgi:suppressor of ftsI
MIRYRLMSMRLRVLAYITCFYVFGHLRLAAQAPLNPPNVSRPVLLSDPTPARSPVLLQAVNDPHTGKGAFQFDGREDAPAIRVKPGEEMRVTYVNAMTAHSQEHCIDGPCMNMTNLHFHGLHVSPDAPQDDSITMMATPGQSLHYTVNIPRDQPPGLYWYHTHPHGESYQQDLDGMSGAIVIEGMERYVPEVRHMRERILVLRDQVIEEHDPAGPALRRTVDIPATGCGNSNAEPGHLFTVNGALRPQIAIAPGERQFWRIVNASPDLYADLQVDKEQLQIVALDGMPLSFHDPKRRVKLTSHALVPPAGRLEAVITGPRAGANASLRTRCFDMGPDGDPNPAMVVADLVDVARNNPETPTTSGRPRSPLYKPVSSATIARTEDSPSDFVVTFTEDKKGFYINQKKYCPSDPPMTTVSIGEFHHWRVVNDTHEVHPFHIHQVHFLAYAENGIRLPRPEWLDTVNVPVEGNVDLMMDFTDPIIRGVSLFHCHLLSHEDKGMMAKILFK